MLCSLALCDCFAVADMSPSHCMCIRTRWSQRSMATGAAAGSGVRMWPKRAPAGAGVPLPANRGYGGVSTFISCRGEP